MGFNSFKGDRDSEFGSRRSWVAPRGATSAADDSPHDINLPGAEACSRFVGLPVYPLECDVRASIGATAVLDITATAPSTHALKSQLKRTGRPRFLSPTLATGSVG